MMFALSKINLLILAVALFTIVVYFTFGFQSVLLSNAARQEVAKVIEPAALLINSRSVCGKIEVSIPERLSTAAGQGIYILMEIRSVDVGDRNSLVFSVINRDEYMTAKRRNKEPTIVAGDRRDLRAELRLFSFPEEDTEKLCPSGSTVLGLAYGRVVVDNAVIVKESFGGHDHVYIIPCHSSSNTSCEENTQKVACWVKEQRGEESKCFDTPEQAVCASYDFANCPQVS